MIEGGLLGVATDDCSGDAKSLNPGIIYAVCDLIASSTGSVCSCAGINPGEERGIKDTDPGQLAIALAYAQLCMDEPEMITSRHLKMLRKNFSYEQIQELNLFIKKMVK